MGGAEDGHAGPIATTDVHTVASLPALSRYLTWRIHLSIIHNACLMCVPVMRLTKRAHTHAHTAQHTEGHTRHGDVVCLSSAVCVPA